MNYYAAVDENWALCGYPPQSKSPSKTREGIAFPRAQEYMDHDAQGYTNRDSDEAVIDACLTQDGNHFAALVERYESAVTKVLWHFTRDRLVLEELVQDAFVEAYFSLRRFRKGAQFFPWLRTIATRVGYRSWRRKKRDANREILLARQRPAVLEKRSDTAEYVYHVLELLDPKDRLVLTLQYFEGCSTKEIAERMGWSLSLVKVRTFRARKKLKVLLVNWEQTSHDH